MGGFKIMYEFANRLSDLGYSVHITYPIRTKYMEYRLPYFVRKVLSYIEGFRTNMWFPFNKNISMSYVDSVSNKYIKESDIIIATWWSTAVDMGRLSLSKGKKINLIQGYENWIGHEDELHASYNMDHTVNVVVASYLNEIVKKHTHNNTYLIPNAIDSEKYKLINRIEDRRPLSVCMLYSEQEIKGAKYGLEALIRLKGKYPVLTVDLFGIFPQPLDLPQWITYHRDHENLTEIYNNNSIFIANSLTEGMALTPMEAMFCGCACVLTEIDGHSEYGVNNKTCLLYKPQNIEDLIEKLDYIFSNDLERIKLAQSGHDFIQQFSWNKAVKKLDNIIKDYLIEN